MKAGACVSWFGAQRLKLGGELGGRGYIYIRFMAHVNPAEEVEGGLKDLSLNGGDPYREHLVGDAEAKTAWRHGGPPTYHVVNALFESGRTKVNVVDSSSFTKTLNFCVCHHAVVNVVVVVNLKCLF